ncbi:response regulator [Arcticibacter pallidicorallinus]|nr:response regulator [Arcticibacter pallidicorallinus]
MDTILIIDDDPRNIFALVAVLKTKKFVCLTASSAEEGIKTLLRQPDIGIILMDMMMPDMDGYEAIAEIRKNELVNKVPIIAVTAQAMVGDREKCIAAGANDYISKPIDIDILVELLGQYLNT